jgi:hypothetical protein
VGTASSQEGDKSLPPIFEGAGSVQSSLRVDESEEHFLETLPRDAVVTRMGLPKIAHRGWEGGWSRRELE